jgi:DNA-directed RNA polymerase subunit beta
VRELQKEKIGSLEVPDEYLIGRILAHDVVDKKTGELIATANEELNETSLEKFRKAGVEKISTLWVNDLDRGPYISSTLRIDSTKTPLEALVEIYRMMRPGASRRPRKPHRICSSTCSLRSSDTTSIASAG